MLTSEEQKYLETIPENKIIVIWDFDPAAKETGDQIIQRIKEEGIAKGVLNMGSTELGIAGQNDIDIDVPSSVDTSKVELSILKKLFGKPKQSKILPMKWEFKQNGFEVEVHLADASTETFKRHLRVFTALKNDPVLRTRYEALKKSCNGGSFRDYMKKKFEFFADIS